MAKMGIFFYGLHSQQHTRKVHRKVILQANSEDILFFGVSLQDYFPDGMKIGSPKITSNKVAL